MRHRGVIIGGIVAVILGLSGWAAARTYSHRDPVNHRTDDPAAQAPQGVRVRLEVLNATTIHGLARHATLMLRDHGFDVVLIGSSPERLDSVQVLDRSGHPDWAARVAAALGGARVIERPDTSHYVDVTVLLGTRWRPPAQPFYP